MSDDNNRETNSQSKRFSVVFSHVSEAILILDAQGQLLSANEKAGHWLGLKDKEGQTISINVLNEKRQNLELTEILRRGQVDFFKDKEFYLSDPCSKMEMAVRVRVARIDPEEEFIILIKDITAEKELAKLKDDFINIVSDKLRTPATVVKDYLWLISTDPGNELPDKVRDYLNKAVGGTERMIALISDILSASSLEQGRIDLKIEAVSLNDLVLEELDELKARVEQRGLKIEIQDFTGMPPVYGDKRRIIEVLANFIDNSIKYTEQGFVKIGVSREQGFVRVEITDSGKGFAPEDKNKLFSKFGRLDNSLVTVAEASGTGLGLYISKMLVSKMSGAVGASSEGVGQGATFWFSLPIAGSWK